MKTKIKLIKLNKKNTFFIKKNLDSYFRELNKSKNFIPNKNLFNKLIKDKNITKYIVKVKNQNSGFILIKLYKDINNKKICLIKDFFIEKKFRRKNIGIDSIKSLMKILKNKKISLIKINILSNNKSAKNFWLNFKLKQELISYKIKF